MKILIPVVRGKMGHLVRAFLLSTHFPLSTQHAQEVSRLERRRAANLQFGAEFVDDDGAPLDRNECNCTNFP